MDYTGIMLFKRFFSAPAPVLQFSPDLGGDDTQHLLSEMKACLNRTGGTLTNARRANALAALFGKLTPAGRQRFIEVLNSLDETGAVSTSERYSQIEEAELFGRPSTKLAILDAFETPRKRILSQLKSARDGNQTIAMIRDLADDELSQEIDNI